MGKRPPKEADVLLDSINLIPQKSHSNRHHRNRMTLFVGWRLNRGFAPRHRLPSTPDHSPMPK